MKRTYFAAAAVALVCLTGCSAEPEIAPEELLPEPGVPVLEQQPLSCAVEAAGNKSPTTGIVPNFCPNCGAKMDGGADND